MGDDPEFHSLIIKNDSHRNCIILGIPRHRATFTMALGDTRYEQSESIAHESSGGLVVTNGKIISNEYVEIPCDTGCPPNSYCENGTCRCNAGYTGNTKQGCHDIDECERSPCTESDSWCVNLPGSFQCCTTRSNILGDGESHESNVAESSSSNGSIGGRGGKWKVETFGEWRNFSGGAIVIGRGKIENGMWNITGGEGEEEVATLSEGKKKAERLISLISGLRKGSDPDKIETPNIGTQRFIVVDNGILKAVGSGSGGAELSASGVPFIEKDDDALKQSDRERTNFTRSSYGTGAAHMAVAIGGTQERPSLSMNGTIAG
uniref:EGF-like calcium-binding domain-containing protein n=1 Tax=Parascaris equorum TaxID=6256 RepID=A0A914S4G6_PAREQ